MTNEELNISVFKAMCSINEECYNRKANCRGCIYHSEHQDMGATMDVCNREKDLGKAVAACEKSANCGNKMTLSDVQQLKAERDELIENILRKCNNCKHCNVPVNAEPCNSCFVRKPVCTHSKWEWRGCKNE